MRVVVSVSVLEKFIERHPNTNNQRVMNAPPSSNPPLQIKIAEFASSRRQTCLDCKDPRCTMSKRKADESVGDAQTASNLLDPVDLLDDNEFERR